MIYPHSPQFRSEVSKTVFKPPQGSLADVVLNSLIIHSPRGCWHKRRMQYVETTIQTETSLELLLSPFLIHQMKQPGTKTPILRKGPWHACVMLADKAG